MKKMTILALILVLAIALTACGSEKAPEPTAAATVATAVSAAAAGDEDDGKDDQPNPVIVEKIAKTVVHNDSSVNDLEGRGLFCRRPSVIIICRRSGNVRLFCRKAHYFILLRYCLGERR